MGDYTFPRVYRRMIVSAIVVTIYLIIAELWSMAFAHAPSLTAQAAQQVRTVEPILATVAAAANRTNPVFDHAGFKGSQASFDKLCDAAKHYLSNLRTGKITIRVKASRCRYVTKLVASHLQPAELDRWLSLCMSSKKTRKPEASEAAFNLATNVNVKLRALNIWHYYENRRIIESIDGALERIAGGSRHRRGMLHEPKLMPIWAD